jgi:hypothetical protein
VGGCDGRSRLTTSTTDRKKSNGPVDCVARNLGRSVDEKKDERERKRGVRGRRQRRVSVCAGGPAECGSNGAQQSS